MFDIQAVLIEMAPYVQYVSFVLLLLAGLSLPISEDIVFIVSASLAATVVPENTLYIFAGCFLGAMLSDIEAYLIGRFGLHRVLFSNALIRLNIINRERIEKKIGIVTAYFIKYGGKTLFFGRFIPFGMRNILFMTSGLIRLNFIKFLLIDLCALICTSSVLFYLGYSFGNNFQQIIPYLNRYKLFIFVMVACVLLLYFIKKKLIKYISGGQSTTLKADPSKNPIIE